jgi:hypothetical protein
MSAMRVRLALVALILIGVGVQAAAAGADTTVQTIPVVTPVDACGETIALSGNLLFVETIQGFTAGGFVVGYHFNAQGVSGISTTGIAYRGVGSDESTSVVVPSGGFVTTSVTRWFHLVGTAGAPTYYLKGIFHLTINANGEVTVSFDKFTAECL